jgi:DNA-binding NarL/FixJ family response regulator
VLAAERAAGMTNRQIANEFYMSLRSVESHLTNIYRHHGVRSRSQLAAVLARAGAEATQSNGASTVDGDSVPSSR